MMQAGEASIRARGGVILGNGFQVQSGATLSVTVNKSQ
jgi:hypothetical protein